MSLATRTVLETGLRLGSGWVTLFPGSAAPAQFIDDRAPQRQFLLHEGIAWHGTEHQWGSGHVVSDRGTARWSTPTGIEFGVDRVSVRFSLVDGLELEVTRTGGDRMVERFEFRNTAQTAVEITGLGIQTPFADLYEDSSSAIRRSVNAHVFTGGSWAWVLAQPMSGEGRSLGVIVRDGALWGYSIESRNQVTFSNARGHVVLHVTDRARSPHAFGGQPTITLAAGESYVLSWEIGWFDDLEAFIAETRPPATFSQLAARTDSPIHVTTEGDVVCASPNVNVRTMPGGVVLTCSTPGTYSIEIGGSARTEVEFHRSVQDTAVARINYILAHQRARERAGDLAYAFVPVDTATGLTQTTNGWLDWSDGAERIGMAVLMQRALTRGWVGLEADAALDGWAGFARAHLIDAAGASRRGSQLTGAEPRLYDAPWLSWFFVERYRFTGDPEELEVAVHVLGRALELGIARFLAIELSGACIAVAEELDLAGRGAEARDLREQLVAGARHFLELGDCLPAHEVAYEQSMVAPLVELLVQAYRITGEAEFLHAAEERLAWLLAFGGPQPHARLNGVAIRHWDGYWFGMRRQWGDVFPHYWSTLTAAVLARLPAELRTPERDALALTILRANMSNYFADGSATCAFILPTAVDGAPAHAPDTLANDQDWHLAIWLELATNTDLPLD